MKFILGTIISLLSFFILYFFVAIFSPESYEVERVQDFSQPKQVVWHKFSRFRNWESWFPWNSSLNTIRFNYVGVPGRTGAKLEWKTVESETGSMIVTRIEPFVELEYVWQSGKVNGVSKALVRLDDFNSGTLVTWKTRTDLTFWEKPLGALGFYQSQIGAKLEQGLSAIETELNFD